MSVRRAPFNLQAAHAHRTATALREMAEMADEGRLIGVAVGMVMADNNHKAFVAGVCEKNTALAYLLAGKLKNAILNG